MHSATDSKSLTLFPNRQTTEVDVLDCVLQLLDCLLCVMLSWNVWETRLQ
jgi:hypothetical protein